MVTMHWPPDVDNNIVVVLTSTPLVTSVAVARFTAGVCRRGLSRCGTQLSCKRSS